MRLATAQPLATSSWLPFLHKCSIMRILLRCLVDTMRTPLKAQQLATSSAAEMFLPRQSFANLPRARRLRPTDPRLGLPMRISVLMAEACALCFLRKNKGRRY